MGACVVIFLNSHDSCQKLKESSISRFYMIGKSVFLAIFCLSTNSALAIFDSDVTRGPEASKINDPIDFRKGVDVNANSGALTHVYKDVVIPGNGGLDIEITRRFDSTRVREMIWNKYFIYGVSVDKYIRAEYGMFGAETLGWSMTVAPIVTINNSYTQNPNTLCTGEPFVKAGVNYNRMGVSYRLTLPSGEQDALVPTGIGVATSRGGWKLTCPGGTHMLVSPKGVKYTMALKVSAYKIMVVDNLDSSYYTQLMTTRQEDANGNWVQYNYANLPQASPVPYLTSIQASDGRSISLNYDQSSSSATVYQGYAYPRLSQINGPNGAVWKYGYDSSGRLASVEMPEGRIWRYGYWPVVSFDGNIGIFSGSSGLDWGEHLQQSFAKSNQLKRIEIPSGGVIEFDYVSPFAYYQGCFFWECVSGYEVGVEESLNNFYLFSDESRIAGSAWDVRVKSKDYLNGNKWTYIYTFARNKGAYDITTISGPGGVEEHSFIGFGYFVDASAWQTPQQMNYGYASSGPFAGFLTDAWKLGLLMKVKKGSSYEESYEWDKRTHSDIYMHTAAQGFIGLRDSVTYAAQLKTKTITQDGAVHTSYYSNFDSYGNPQLITESGPNGGSRATTITYFNDTGKWIIGKLKDETFTGGSLLRSFDANGNMLSMNRDNVTTSFTYDAQGNISTKTMPRGLLYSYSGYKRGVPQTESQPEGVNVTRVVDDAGNITSEVNGENKITSYTYDKLRRLKSVAYPIGNAKAIVYTANSKTETRGSLVEATQYDGFGRPVSVTLGGITTTFGYDALGRQTFKSNPGTPTVGTNYQYDALNRLTRQDNADGTFNTIVYGAGKKTLKDERSNETVQTFRSYGDPSQQFLMSSRTVVGGETQYLSLQRNARDLVTWIFQGTPTDNQIREYEYDSRYYLTSVTNPETGTTIYGRDDAGNMTSSKVGSAPVTNYTYDGRNRETGITYASGTPNVTKTYNKVDKLKSVTSTAAARSFIYDDNNNLTTESLVVDGLTFSTIYGYNTNDQLSSVTYPRSNRVVSYAPDVLGRPTKAGSYVTSVSYWPSGQLKQVVYANGTISNYGQNNRLWPSTFDTKKGTATTTTATYLNSSYGYDGLGNLTSLADSVDSSYNRTLGYDPLNRLTSATGPWGTGTIGYDATGNITRQLLGSSSLYYTYDTNGRFRSVSGIRASTLTHGGMGNITAGLGATYTYDAVPNLRCVNCNNASTKVEYTYDGLTNRVTVTKGGVKSYEVKNTSNNQLIEFTPSQGNKLTEYVYLGNKRVAQVVSP